MSRFEQEDGLDTSWQDQANCAGVDRDYMYPTTLEEEAIGKAVCDGCLVQVECYDYAHESGQTQGIWGGQNFGPDLEA